jgi:two-component sensor histidine kinase
MIRFDCAVRPLEFSSNRAAAFALLLNELATNAAKHAYGPEGGVVHVKLEEINGARVLEVRDTGHGLPVGFDIQKPVAQSLGMRLIQTLTQSLNGTLTASNQGGAVFRVTF